MHARLHHENLIVYQRSIEFVAWAEEALESVKGKASAKDHLDRAAMSVPLQIAESNSKSSARDRIHCIEIGIGSALECAACLDVICARSLLDSQCGAEGKSRLHTIVSMLHGLKKPKSGRFAEEETPYEKAAREGAVYFGHERLQVYQSAIELAGWCHRVEEADAVNRRTADLLDRSSTSVALNIAEGNGRFSTRDRARFLETATTSALRCAATIDVLAAKASLGGELVEEGKVLVCEIVRMLRGLRDSVLSSADAGEGDGGGEGS